MFLTCGTLTTGILTWIKGTCCICMVKIRILLQGCQIVQFGNTKARILFLREMVAHILIAVKNKKSVSLKIWSRKIFFVSQLTYPTPRTLLNSLLCGYIFLPFWKELQAKSDTLLYLGLVYNYFCGDPRFRMILLHCILQF